MRYRRIEGIEFVDAPNGYIAYYEDGKRAVSLNTTAALVLELCDGSSELHEIEAFMREELGEALTAPFDIKVSLQPLLNHGLVEPYFEQPRKSANPFVKIVRTIANLTKLSK